VAEEGLAVLEPVKSAGGGTGRVSGYGIGDGDSGPPMFMDLATIDERDGSRAGDGGAFVTNGTTCLQPRAAVAVHDHVVVACLGSHRLEELGNPHGQHSLSALLGNTEVPAGPTALAVSRGEDQVFVWSAFARSLSRVETQAELRLPREKKADAPTQRRGLGQKPAKEIAIARVVARDEAWLHGRDLFFGNGNPGMSADGRSCATCHIDGRDDGITWDTPKGKRRTRTLAGQLANAPYGWLGEHATLEDHVKITLKQLGGRGLAEDDFAALVGYVRSLPAPASASPSLPAVAHGREIFQRAECGECHVSGGSDRTVHDVGTGGGFMTPTLAGIGARKQLMHDGRFASLDKLLAGSKKMGLGSSLEAEDRAALVEYLQTL
jgi:cytochrome c553